MSARQAPVPPLDDLPDHCWKHLAQAVDDRSNPWRTPAVGTRSNSGAALRTVVLRAACSETRELLVYTDARSSKAGELDLCPWLSWLFWDDRRKEQLRCEGPVTLHREDGFAEAQWRALSETSRANYRQTRAPGTPLGEHSPGSRVQADEASDFAHFLVVRCRIELLDWLRLDRTGHHRARIAWSAPRWNAAWVAP